MTESKNKNLRIMVVGSGGREHAVAWKLNQDPRVESVFCVPGNFGMQYLHGICIVKEIRTPDEMVGFAKAERIDLAVIGPERYLEDGLADEFRRAGIPAIGPSKAAARLEASKAYNDDVCSRLGLPVPDYKHFLDPEKAQDFVRKQGRPLVVKCDGLAAGKGSIVCDNTDQAVQAVGEIFRKQAAGEWGGNGVVVQKRIYGREISVFGLSDGRSFVPLPFAQDYKRAYPGDQGKNTGGMGSYSPHPWGDQAADRLWDIARRLITGLRDELHIPYEGFIYLGMIFDDDDLSRPVILETNVRLGDPETAAIIPRIDNFLDLILAARDCRLSEVKPVVSSGYCLAVSAVMGPTRGKKGAYKGYPDRYALGKQVMGLNGNNGDDGLIFSAGMEMAGNDPEKLITSGGRVLHCVGLGASLDEARTRAYDRIEALLFDGMRYRNDIGC